MSPDVENKDTSLDQPLLEKSFKKEYKMEIVWKNVFRFIVLHVYGLYGLYQLMVVVKPVTLIVALVYGYFGSFCITAGYHRLWTHKSYKARLLLKIIYMLGACICGQNDIYVWVRDHRMHHKFVDTDADPHNIKRGFFFAHMGWLMCKKHPDVIEKGKTIDMSDILADPVVRFQRKYFIELVILFSFILPTFIGYYYLGESLFKSFSALAMGRYLLSLHFTWTVNSFAHYSGYQTFDKTKIARDNIYVSFITMGEGWHNYHHVFPWDYSTSELGYLQNLTKFFIDLIAFFGLAYDLRTATPYHVYYKRIYRGDHLQRWFTNPPIKLKNL